MLKRAFDFVASGIGLIVFSPLLVPTIIAVWLYDFHSPFYRPLRVGRNGRMFKMMKLRSMVVNADKVGAASTSNTDNRITPVGHFIRRYKLDELIQLWNVFTGDMSLVGPRPTLQWEVDSYSEEEKLLVSVRPGITNLASIVFSDEGEILKDSKDADADYLRWIRPGKSRLALVTIKNPSFVTDIKVILLTAMAIVSKKDALRGVHDILVANGAEPDLIKLAERSESLGAAQPVN